MLGIHLLVSACVGGTLHDSSFQIVTGGVGRRGAGGGCRVMGEAAAAGTNMKWGKNECDSGLPLLQTEHRSAVLAQLLPHQ